MRGTSTLATAIADNGSFGNVCLGSFREEDVRRAAHTSQQWPLHLVHHQHHLFLARVPTVLGGLNGGAGNTRHVFRTSIGASTWTDISPLLDLPYSAIALDGTDTPTAI